MITAGARFDFSIPEHLKALYAAIEAIFDSTVAMLIQRGQLTVVDVYDVVKDYSLPPDLYCDTGPGGLVFAAMRGLTLTFDAIIQSGVPIDVMGQFGKTALHYAAENEYSRAIPLLLEHGSDVNAYTSRDNGVSDRLTALHLAATHGHTDAVQILCEHGARVNQSSALGAYTPLHLAASNGHPDTVRKLLKYGADLNREDLWGWTPLDHAIEYHREDAETCLREQGALRGKKGTNSTRRNSLTMLEREGLEIAEEPTY